MEFTNYETVPFIRKTCLPTYRNSLSNMQTSLFSYLASTVCYFLVFPEYLLELDVTAYLCILNFLE